MVSYGPLCTEFYDLDKPEPPPDELEFYAGVIARAGGPALEAMCGSGRFLLPLLARGLEIEGVDSSPHMLEACRSRAKARGIAPVLYEQSLQSLRLPRRYRAVILPGGSFSLLTRDNEIQDSLARLRAVLGPGGRLVLEVVRLPDSGLPADSLETGQRSVHREDGTELKLHWWVSRVTGTPVSKHRHRYERIRSGHVLQTELEEMSVRSYGSGELEPILREAGFREIRMARGAPLTRDSLVFECIEP